MVFKAVKEPEAKPAKKTPAKRIEEPEDDYDDYGDEPEEPRRKRSGGKKAVLIIVIVLAVLAAGAAAGGYAVRASDKIFPNVTINGTDVGGMTVAEAAGALKGDDQSSWENAAVTVVLPAGCQITVNAKQAGAAKSPEDTAQAAYEYGRDGELYSGLYKYLKCSLSGANVSADASELDEDYIKQQIKTGVEAMKDALSDETYNLDTDKKTLSIVKGAGSVTVDEDEIYKMICDALAAGNYSQIEYQYKTSDASDSFDMQKLHDEVFKEPKDASYDTASGKVTESVTGVDFDVAEAQKLYDAAAAGDTVEIPVTVTEPKINSDDLGDKLFADKLGTQTTSFKSSGSNRVNNIALAAKKIDGVILNPGEEFSYNGTVGQRTESAGFKKAGAYANGKVVQELGGGICQVSSTLYCSVLYANLEITDRTCHYFPVDYLPAGLDATVSWKSPDFKFKNNRDYPIKISAKCDTSKKTLTVEIWGTNVDGSYVEMKYSTWKFYDSKYPTVALGYKATTYRNLFDKDGKLISSTKEATSTYHYHQEHIVYPSATPKTTPTPKPAATPTPAPAAPSPSPEATLPVIDLPASSPAAGQ